ncbi:VIT1/CCC1 transporter family protein, partial [Bordetella pertussis]|uniref:VIT1/CCC1 transporter family protein n=1 Tax=Bordetella pertussis TaxID=520 RepID=UPI00070AB91D
MPARSHHRIFRSGWLRAAVLGANDGIVSTASLIAGVAAAQASYAAILTSGLAGLVAGALSMAAGEYVSVKSQADIEAADLRLEQSSLKRNSREELEELTGIYVERGLSPDLAGQVARQLTRHNALDAHARDELGISVHNRAQPVQAALASAASFAVGLMPVVIAGSVAGLGILGAVAARAGGAPVG